MFLLGVGGICMLLMIVFPEKPIALFGGMEIKYPTWDKFWKEDTTGVKVDMNVLLRTAHVEQVDSAAEARKLKKEEEAKLRLLLKARELNFNASDTIHLPHFKTALSNLKKNGGEVRVLHYGDSQIEGDRITSYIREKFQTLYGGNGPGLQPAAPFVGSFSVQHTASPNWLRYTAFGKKDTTIDHKRFGYRGIFSRFTEAGRDLKTADSTSAWIEFKPSKSAYSHARSFRKMQIYFGHHRAPVRIQVFLDDVLFADEIVQPAKATLTRTFSFDKVPGTVKLVFSGVDSPDVYGISLDGMSGIQVDNIAMRGASGTIFTSIDRKQYAEMVEGKPISLVLLQYGGNTVPYLKNEKQIKDYGNWMKSQIRFFRRVLPNADIVMIGPSDMSTKIDGQYKSYPMLKPLRDELKKVALEEHCGFWDIFGAMGGENSMPSWVSANPPLAGPDYVHFTPKGAKQIAEWLAEAMLSEVKEKSKAKEETTASK